MNRTKHPPSGSRHSSAVGDADREKWLGRKENQNKGMESDSGHRMTVGQGRLL